MINGTEKLEADKIIEKCLSLDNPKSFFLFAGAGAGKTTSLITALKYIKSNLGSFLQLQGKQVGVITFTNAAAEEIMNRAEVNTLFCISTIHSFAWNLIKGFDKDIRDWLKTKLRTDIEGINRDIKNKENNSRVKEDTILKLRTKLDKKINRLQQLDNIKRFTYNPAPSALNIEKDSLSHQEVLELFANFLLNKKIFQNIFIQKFPILFIDESQDTDKNLMEAFLDIQQKYKDKFLLGLFGDTKQRIYNTGKNDLGNIDWGSKGFETPTKKINWRSENRIIELANEIGKNIDQTPCQEINSNKPEGFVRLFIAPTNSNRNEIEIEVKNQMSEITGDLLWKKPVWTDKEGAILLLEHRMAAIRLNFKEMWDSLRNLKNFEEIKSGNASEINWFANFIFPIIKTNNAFELANIVKKYNKHLFENINHEGLTKIQNKISNIKNAYNNNNDITFGEMFNLISFDSIFDIPTQYIENQEQYKNFFNVHLKQIDNYSNYVNDQSAFRTHHGVKGLEFENVMAIIDDQNSNWKQYKYYNCLTRNCAVDDSMRNTLRLLYVICTRARKSLAVVLYDDNVTVENIDNNKFKNNEIIFLN